MTYPMQHRIDMRHKYTRSENTDIRKTFQLARENAESKKWPVVDADPVPAGTSQRKESGDSTAECH